MGIVKMKQIARGLVWWPKIDKQLELTTSKCEGCLSTRNAPPKVQIHPWEPCKSPWERIHLDFASNQMGKFLICVDAFSKWPEVIPMRSTAAPFLIDAMKVLFSRWGLPKKVVSDNGPEFISKEFSCFLLENGIKQKTSPVGHPSSNGLAERHVQNVKKALRKMDNEPGSLTHKLSKFLLAYRNAPHSLTNESPAQLFLKRDLRTKLSLIYPDHAEKAQEKTEKMVEQRGGVKNTEFFVGQNILCKNFSQGGKPWVNGTILARQGTLTYIVQIGPNKFVKRHFNQLIRLRQDDDQPDHNQVVDLNGENDSNSDSVQRNYPITASPGTCETLTSPERPTHSASGSGTSTSASNVSNATNLSSNTQHNSRTPVLPQTGNNQSNVGPVQTEGLIMPSEESERRYPLRNRNIPSNLRDYDLGSSESP